MPAKMMSRLIRWLPRPLAIWVINKLWTPEQIARALNQR